MGDDGHKPVTETIRITLKITKALDLKVKAYMAGKGTILYSYGAIDPCPRTMPGCSPCSESTKCSSSQHPVCDGSSEVQCKLKAPTPEVTQSRLQSRRHR